MTKLKLFKTYREEEVPDHVLEEIHQMVNEIVPLILSRYKDKSPNLILNAISNIHAALICAFVKDDDEQIKNAALHSVKCFLSKIDVIRKSDIFKETYTRNED